MTDLRGNTFIEGPVGRLEAILKEPDGPRAGVAVVCHPHPLFGGTMHNKVVYQIARAFENLQFSVLRFNFRGTALSAGTHDEGRGEQDDLRAAIAFMTNRLPGAPLWTAGFSFGAAVMLRSCCQSPGVQGLVAAGTPVSNYTFDEIIACDLPKLFIQGQLDQFGAPSELERLVNRLSGPKRLEIIAGADHFFEGRLPQVREVVTRFVADHLASVG